MLWIGFGNAEGIGAGDEIEKCQKPVIEQQAAGTGFKLVCADHQPPARCCEVTECLDRVRIWQAAARQVRSVMGEKPLHRRGERKSFHHFSLFCQCLADKVGYAMPDEAACVVKPCGRMAPFDQQDIKRVGEIGSAVDEGAIKVEQHRPTLRHGSLRRGRPEPPHEGPPKGSGGERQHLQAASRSRRA